MPKKSVNWTHGFVPTNYDIAVKYDKLSEYVEWQKGKRGAKGSKTVDPKTSEKVKSMQAKQLSRRLLLLKQALKQGRAPGELTALFGKFSPNSYKRQIVAVTKLLDRSRHLRGKV